MVNECDFADKRVFLRGGYLLADGRVSRVLKTADASTPHRLNKKTGTQNKAKKRKKTQPQTRTERGGW